MKPSLQLSSSVELTFEQQFELQVFEKQVQTLSQEDAQVLLVKLKEAMLYQTTTFREILKETWGIGKGVDVIGEALAEG
ncbi:MAG: NblA/ycf18 family protein [Cyanobacteria bacterium J06636_16]